MAGLDDYYAELYGKPKKKDPVSSGGTRSSMDDYYDQLYGAGKSLVEEEPPTAPPVVEDDETTWGETAKGWGISALEGFVDAGQTAVDLSAGALGAVPMLGALKMLGYNPVEDNRRAFSDQAERARQTLEQMKPEAWKKEFENEIVEQDENGNFVGFNAPTAEQLMGTTIRSAISLPQAIAGGLAAQGRGAAAKILAYGLSNASVVAPMQYESSYREAIKAKKSEEEARNIAERAAFSAGALSTATGGLGFTLAERLGAKASGPIKAIIKGVMGDAPFETIEEGGQSVIEDLTMGREVNPITASNRAALGALATSLPGAATGYAGNKAKVAEKKQKDAENTLKAAQAVADMVASDRKASEGIKFAQQFIEGAEIKPGSIDFTKPFKQEFSQGPVKPKSFDTNPPSTLNIEEFDSARREGTRRATEIQALESEITAAKKTAYGSEPVAAAIERARKGIPDPETSGAKATRLQAELASRKARLADAAVPKDVQADVVTDAEQVRAANAEDITSLAKKAETAGRLEAEAAARAKTATTIPPGTKIGPENFEAMRTQVAATNEATVARARADEARATLARRQAELEAAKLPVDPTVSEGLVGRSEIVEDAGGKPRPLAGTAIRYEGNKPVYAPEQQGFGTASFNQTSGLDTSEAYRAKPGEFGYSPADLSPKSPEVPTSSLLADAALTRKERVSNKKGKKGQAAPIDQAALLRALESKQVEMTDESIDSLVSNPDAPAKIVSVSYADSANDSDVVQYIKQKRYEKHGNAQNYLKSAMEEDLPQEYKDTISKVLASHDLSDVKMLVVDSEKMGKDRKELDPRIDTLEDAAGYYNPKTNTIVLKGRGWFDQHGMNHEAALHEVTHAVTLKTIREVHTGDKLHNRKVRKAVWDLDNIVQNIDTLITSKDSSLAEALKDVSQETIRAVTQGPNRTAELVSYALTHKPLRDALKNISSSNPKFANLWQRLKYNLSTIFLGAARTDSKAESLLDRILENTDLLIAQPRDGKKGPNENSIVKVGGTPKTTPKANLVPEKQTEDYAKLATADASGRIAKTVVGAAKGARKLFSNTQGKPQQVDRVLREWESRRLEATTKVMLVMNQIGDMLKTQKVTSSQITNDPTLLDKPGMEGLKSRFKALDREVNRLSRLIGKEILKSGTAKSQTELRSLAKILTDPNYRTRTYKLFAPSARGKKFAEERWANYQKYKDSDLSKLTETQQNDVIAVKLGREQLYNSYMRFMKPPSEMGDKQLRTKYEFWTHRSAHNIPIEAVQAEMQKLYDDINAGGFNMEAEIDKVTKEALDLTATENTTMARLRPRGMLDRTVVTPRTDLPEAIRNLWGENKDVLVNYVQTLYHQNKFLAELQGLNELRDMGEGKWLFPPGAEYDRDKYSETLQGKGYGPLDGWHTTPFVKESLSHFQEAEKATGKVMLAWETLVRAAKLGVLIFYPMKYALNFASAWITPVMHGNYAYKGSVRGIKAAWQFVDAPNRREMSQDALLALLAGVQDSALMGELQSVEAKQAVKKIFEDRIENKDTLGVLVKHAYNFKKAAPELASRGLLFAKDVFAMMDVWAKVGNFLGYELPAVRKFHELAGDGTSEAEMVKEAAERVSRVNFSYHRAFPLIKMAEKFGGLFFFTYFSEVFRVSAANLVLGAHDVREATKVGGKAGDFLRTHGLKRLAGTSAVLGAMGLGLLERVADALGDGDDEDEKAIKDAMGERYDNGALVRINTAEDGTRTYFDLSRLDPYDPLTRIIRAFVGNAAEGNWEEAGKAALEETAELFFANPALKAVFAGVSGTDKKPTLFYSAPNSYNEARDKWDKAFGNAELSDDIIAARTTFEPTYRNRTVAGEQLKDGKIDFTTYVANGWGGANLIVFDPAKEIEIRFRTKYRPVLNEAASKLTHALETARDLPDEELEALYVEKLEAEYDAFVETAKVVRAARASGMSRFEIAKQLKKAEAGKEIGAMLLRDKFSPKAAGDSFLDDVNKRLVDGAGKDRKEAFARSLRVQKLRDRVTKLHRKYYNYTEEEN